MVVRFTVGRSRNRKGVDNPWPQMTRAATIAALLFSLSASAQLNHDLPPAINLVGAGFNQEFAAQQRKVSVWTMGLGTLATGILLAMDDTRHTAAPLVVGTATVGVSMTFSLSGLKWMDRSADLLKCGYSPNALYEMVPDSIGDDRPRKMMLPDLIDGTPVKLPARMRTE